MEEIVRRTFMSMWNREAATKKALAVLSKMNIETPRALAHFLPKTYTTTTTTATTTTTSTTASNTLRAAHQMLQEWRESEEREKKPPRVVVTGELSSAAIVQPPFGFPYLSASIVDSNGDTSNFFVFRKVRTHEKQLLQAKAQKQTIMLTGRLKGATRPGRALPDTFSSVEVDIVSESDGTVGVGGDGPKPEENITPLYPSLAKLKDIGLTTNQFRDWVRQALEIEARIPDIFTAEQRTLFNIVDKQTALYDSHFPRSSAHLARAVTRLKFEELLTLSLLFKRQQQRERERREGHTPASAATAVFVPLETADRYLTPFVASLPFTLSQEQVDAIDRIRAEITGTSTLGPREPLRMLLQGDTGSGKTVVGIAALLLAISPPTPAQRTQAVLLAPTETLIQQHFDLLLRLVAPLGVEVVLLKGGQGVRIRRKILREIQNGHAQIICGTHAVFQESVEYHNCILNVVDEQHRFGLMQRQSLLEKSGSPRGGIPHLLMMSATPIPRSLALTIFGNVQVCVLSRKLPGRRDVVTKVCSSAAEREAAFARLRQEVEAGQQGFVVYPIIEETAHAAYKHLKSITDNVADLQKTLPGHAVGMLHGQQDVAERMEMMDKFRRGEIRVLVATTVVEVGIDCPNATVIIVEGSDMMGLSTLHQLRGRVGRSSLQSYCFLMTNKDEVLRLRVMQDTNDGFAIAEHDLRTRGMGQPLGGAKQSGFGHLLSMSNIVDDEELTKRAVVAVNSLTPQQADILAANAAVTTAVTSLDYIDMF